MGWEAMTGSAVSVEGAVGHEQTVAAEQAVVCERAADVGHEQTVAAEQAVVCMWVAAVGHEQTVAAQCAAVVGYTQAEAAAHTVSVPVVLADLAGQAAVDSHAATADATAEEELALQVAIHLTANRQEMYTLGNKVCSIISLVSTSPRMTPRYYRLLLSCIHNQFMVPIETAYDKYIPWGLGLTNVTLLP